LTQWHIYTINFFDLSSDYPTLLIIRQLRKILFSTFYQKKTSSMKQSYLRDIFKEASKSVCTSTIVVSPDPLSPTSSSSSAVMAPESMEEDPDDPEPAA